jgi:DNA polymerase III gamma/tau subunit
LSHNQILDQLKTICEKENIKIDTSALHLLAQQATGSMRDGETLLDQIIPFATDTITAEIITESLGLIDRKVLWDSLKALLERRPLDLMATVRNLYEYGHDMKHYTQDLLTFLRHLSIFQVCSKMKPSESPPLSELLDLPDNEMETLKSLAQNTTPEESQRLFRLLSKSFFEITHSTNPRFALEMTLLRMSQSPPLNDINSLIDEIRNIQKGIPHAPAPSANRLPVVASSPIAPSPSRKMRPIPVTTHSLWEQIFGNIKTHHRTFSSALQECQIISCTPEEIIIGVPKGFLQEIVNDSKNKEVILEIAKTLTGNLPRYEVRVLTDLEPIKTESLKKHEERKELSEELKDHPIVKEFQNIFDAEIEDVKRIKNV